MKQILCMMLALLLVLPLWACAQKQDSELLDPVPFYYLRVQDPDNLHHGSTDSIITPEDQEAHGFRNDLDTLLGRYFSGPESEVLQSPFPRGTQLVQWERKGTMLCLTLTDAFAELSDIDLTLACACVTLTCLELTDAVSVQISAESAALNGKDSVIMDRNALLLIDSGYVSTEPTED